MDADEDSDVESIINSDYGNDDDNEDDNDTVFDEIYNAEEAFLDREREEGEYVLGMFRIVRGAPLYAIGITPQSFFGHTYMNVVRYLHMYSIMRLAQFDIHILKIVKRRHYITQTMCFYSIEVINKSIWLRLIQRHWKCAFQRFRVRQINCIWEMQGCGKMFSQRKGGKVGLRGLMNVYKNIYR
jgi:hypothetical protein